MEKETARIIFVVDDNDLNLTMAKQALKNQYRVMTIPSAEKMFALMEKVTPDLILLDIEMPVMDGFEALKRLKSNSNYSDIPVIFLTGMRASDVEVRGFQLGVVDFITKPFSAPVLVNRIKTHLDIDEVIRERTAQLRDKTNLLQNLQNGMVHVLADMVESRDKNTGGHIERTAAYLDILINAMVQKQLYAEELANEDLEQLISSARLHDVGKISISDSILNKPGKLTDEEYEIMKTHCAVGEEIIDRISVRTGNSVDFLYNARLFAGSHHERWDGKGYPKQLAGNDIPLFGRIMAVVDVYDALVSERPYKKPFSPDEAVRIIMEGAGTQFDPRIANVFYESRELFKAVSMESSGGATSPV